MAATIKKLGLEGTVGVEGPTLEVPYLITGAITYDEASTEFANNPELDPFVVIGGFTLPYHGFRFAEKGGGKWEFFAKYNRREVTGGDQAGGPDEGGGQNQPAFTFDTTGGGTAHITQALEEVAVYNANPLSLDPLPDFEGAIGVTDDGVQGTDIELPGYSFSYTNYIPIELWTPQYRLKLRNLTQKVNDAAWTSPSGDHFEKGEVRFRGAQGSRRGWDDVELTLHFHGESNETLPFGTTTGIVKEGQHYVWFRYQRAASNDIGVHRPEWAVVDRVYKYGNFADLNP